MNSDIHEHAWISTPVLSVTVVCLIKTQKNKNPKSLVELWFYKMVNATGLEPVIT